MKIIPKLNKYEREILEKMKNDGFVVHYYPIDAERLIKWKIIELCRNCLFTYKLCGTNVTIRGIDY